MKYIFYSLLCFLMISCQEVDNFEGPTCTFEGTIIDAETNEPIPLALYDKDGVVRVLEVNDQYPNPYPYDIKVGHDGHFYDSGMFESSYQATPYYMPILSNDTARVTLNPKKTTKVELRGIPYLRISGEVKNDSIYFTITKPDAIPYNGNLREINLMYSNKPNFDRLSVTTEDGTMVSYHADSYAQKDLLNKELVFPISKFTNDIKTESIVPGEYYFRICARIDKATPSNFNYSVPFKGTYVGNK